MEVNIRQLAINTIKTEAEAVKKLADLIDDNFEDAVNFIYNTNGRVIVTGIGKSAIIANKIVATLNSTGSPSIFMHAADAIHGDLGIIQPNDVIICLSKSGNTPEIKVLIPLIRNLGNRNNKIIAIVSNMDSYLAQHADYVLNAHVDAEACPNNLAPTSSTTAQLVIGDAIAICLLNLRGFSAEDFAKVHPGGSLGKKLYLRVSDIIRNEKPEVVVDADINAVIIEISSKMLGATAVLDKYGKLQGIITDGDLRRALQKNNRIDNLTAKDIMSVNPKTIEYSEQAIKAFNIMEKYAITQLLVINNGKYAGMVHIHDLLKEGII
jgi:arabinose-5-phosphate isomerase